MKFTMPLMLSFLITTSACSSSVTKTIETRSILENPESIVIAKSKVYVTNQGKKDWKGADQDGFISKFTREGELKKLKFATGLNDPKGITYFDGHLYVTDIREVVKIDQSSGDIVKRYQTPATFLNDIVISEHGIAYISDTYKSKIYSLNLETDQVVPFMSEMEEAPNGLYLKDNSLYVASWANSLTSDWKSKSNGRFFKIDLTTKKVTNIGQANVGSLDGIVHIGGSNWLIGDKRGNRVYRFNEQDGSMTTLSKIFEDVADFTYYPCRKALFAPLMKSGKMLITPVL